MQIYKTLDGAHTTIKSELVNFIDFFKEKNIIQLGFAFIVSTNISSVTNSFVDNIIMPVLQKILSLTYITEDELKTKTVDIFGIKFGIGQFLSSVIKFILLMYVLYIIYKFTK